MTDGRTNGRTKQQLHGVFGLGLYMNRGVFKVLSAHPEFM